jgi:hypothetical protein
MHPYGVVVVTGLEMKKRGDITTMVRDLAAVINKNRRSQAENVQLTELFSETNEPTLCVYLLNCSIRMGRNYESANRGEWHGLYVKDDNKHDKRP